MTEKCKHLKPDGSRCGNWEMELSGWCYWHNPAVPDADKHAARVRGGEATKYTKLPPSENTNPIPILSRAVAQLEDMKPSPEVLRTITAAASALDRAQERADNRGSDITRIEVIYINDWRND